MVYIIATQVGGIMEIPDISYENYDAIEADNEQSALKIYNEKHNCSYFYGTVVLGTKILSLDEVLKVLEDNKGNENRIPIKLLEIFDSKF